MNASLHRLLIDERVANLSTMTNVVVLDSIETINADNK